MSYNLAKIFTSLDKESRQKILESASKSVHLGAILGSFLKDKLESFDKDLKEEIEITARKNVYFAHTLGLEAIVKEINQQRLEEMTDDEREELVKGAKERQKKRAIEVIECYNRAIEIDPNDNKAWYNKGNTLDDLENYKDAIECYNRAIEIDPKYIAAWNNRGIAFDSLGQQQQVVVHVLAVIAGTIVWARMTQLMEERTIHVRIQTNPKV